MKFEYLLFNLIVFAVPLALSFERRIHFVDKWRHAFPAIILAAIPYWIWETLATGRHWRFHEEHTLGFRIGALPVEECLSFITVPFAALFVWEVLNHYIKPRRSEGLQYFGLVLCLSPVRGLLFFFSGREYTGLVFIALGTAAILDLILHTRLFTQRNVLFYGAFLAILTLAGSGYLTARPIVLYSEPYLLGVRIGSIPLEDFGYILSLILLVTVLYEKLKARGRA